jgi:hypothetical protein
MNSIKKKARVAGSLYLLLSIPAGFCLTSPSVAFIVKNDAATTAQKIKAFELLFRACMAVEIVSAIGFLFVALALYSVFEGFSKPLASLMVTLWAVSIPISCLNVLNKVAVLHILNDANASAGSDTQHINAQVMLFLDMHRYGIILAQIFWGLWLFPLGILIFKSRYLPRVIGILLVTACCAYVVSSLTFLLMPAYGDRVSSVAMFFGGVGELPLMLWLIIKGAKVPSSAMPPPGI